MSRSNPIDLNHAETGAELHFRVLLWLEANVAELGLSLATRRVAERFEVSRSTAYRWLAAYRAAKGLP